jgi:hypothetical protein
LRSVRSSAVRSSAMCRCSLRRPMRGRSLRTMSLWRRRGRLRTLWLQLRGLWRHLLDLACHRLGLGLLIGQ